MEINWKSDRITQRFVERSADKLASIATMTPAELCEASTYCTDWENPFTEELVKRAGSLSHYHKTYNKPERILIIKSAAKSFNVQLF